MMYTWCVYQYAPTFRNTLQTFTIATDFTLTIFLFSLFLSFSLIFSSLPPSLSPSFLSSSHINIGIGIWTQKEGRIQVSDQFSDTTKIFTLIPKILQMTRTL